MHVDYQKLIALFPLKEGQPKTMKKLLGAAHKGDEGGKAQRNPDRLLTADLSDMFEIFEVIHF